MCLTEFSENGLIFQNINVFHPKDGKLKSILCDWGPCIFLIFQFTNGSLDVSTLQNQDFGTLKKLKASNQTFLGPQTPEFPLECLEFAFDLSNTSDDFTRIIEVRNWFHKIFKFQKISHYAPENFKIWS